MLDEENEPMDPQPEDPSILDEEGAPIEAGLQPPLLNESNDDPCILCDLPVDACDLCPERAR